ncbi:MAG: hypothetical protein RLO81_12760 [Fulvivirga sp.]|uniref:hypothetical protein n=1 Tax=Fulvivirga sp. TaxID=1931237 RepID=UPI0032EFB614
MSGRIDKKFCDYYCRNAYNNQVKRDDEQLIMNINKVLRRNRRILKSLCPIGKATVRKAELDSRGYDYRTFSGIYKTNKNQVYYICYDYAFSPLKETNSYTGEVIEKALIVQKQPYFDKLSLKMW